MEPQPLLCTPARGHEFHALAFYPHPTFTAFLVGSEFKIRLEVCAGVFVETVNVFKPLAVSTDSQGKIQFNSQKIATKGFSTDSVRV